MNYFSEKITTDKIAPELRAYIEICKNKIDAIDEVLEKLTDYKAEVLNARVSTFFDGLANYRKKDKTASKYFVGEIVEGYSPTIAWIDWRTSDCEWSKGTDGLTRGKFTITLRNTNRRETIECELDARTKTELIKELTKNRLYQSELIQSAEIDLENLAEITDKYNHAIDTLKALDQLTKSHVTRNHFKN